MSSMDYGVNTVITKRQHPNKTTTYTKIARKVFSNLFMKELSRPALTYYYNININKVNREDQRRASYLI